MANQRSFLLVPNHSMSIDGEVVKIESAEADMLRAVRECFHEVGIAAFITSESNSSLSGAVNFSEVTLHRLNQIEHSSSRAGKLVNYLRAAFTLPFVLARYDFLYIFFPGYCGLVVATWARLIGKPYGLYVRGSWLDRRARTAPWYSWVFTGASFMIVTGESFRRRLQKYCSNVVNEVPLTALRPAQVDSHPAETRSTKRFLFAGNLTESKGVYDVIRAVAILRNEGYEIELAIAGGGIDEQIAAITKLREDLCVQDVVKMRGHLPAEQLAEMYRNSGIFVFPSYYPEGFPRVLYEAMMYSLPIITCKMPGTEGFLVDEENCLYCRPSSPEHLAICLRKLIDDPALAEQLAHSARSKVEQLYDSFIDDSHAQQLLRLLEST